MSIDCYVPFKRFSSSQLKPLETLRKRDKLTTVFFYDSISALRACEPTIWKTALPVLQRLFVEHRALPSSNVPIGRIARALIEFAFPQANPEDSMPPFDREQQQIVAALCAYDPIWKEWRWDTHLKKYGLPDKREDVLALCQQE